MYIRLADLAYPLSEQDIRTANPQMSIPTPMPRSVPGYEWVEPSAPQQAERFGSLVEDTPAQIGGVWTQRWKPSTATLSAAREALTAAVAAERWARETRGIDLPGGVTVATGIDDQNRIMAAINGMLMFGFPSINFKASSGWTTLTLDELKAVGQAVAMHVQACFTAERAHADAIAALPDLAAAEAYDVTANWTA